MEGVAQTSSFPHSAKGGAMPERTYSFIEMRLPMPLMSAAAEPGKLDEAVAHIAAHDVELGRIARAEAHYFRGQPEEAHADAAPFLDHSDPALRISANFICAYADLTLGKIWETRECLTNIAAMRNDESIKATPALHASYVLFYAASSVLLHLSTPYPPGTFATTSPHYPKACAFSGFTRSPTTRTFLANTAAVWAWPKPRS